MSRIQVGRFAGSLGAMAVLMLWTGLAVPSRSFRMLDSGLA